MLSMTSTKSVQFVVFTINSQLYCVYIEDVIEILRLTKIASIPGIRSSIEGVINLRGNIIPVLNLHKRFKLAAPPKHKENRVVIVKGRNENIGIMVEQVRMVTKIDEHAMEPPSGHAEQNDMFLGFAKLDGQVIGILDLEKVLYSENGLT